MSLGYNYDKGPLDPEEAEMQERTALTCAQEKARRLFPLALRSYRCAHGVQGREDPTPSAPTPSLLPPAELAISLTTGGMW